MLSHRAWTANHLASGHTLDFGVTADKGANATGIDSIIGRALSGPSRLTVTSSRPTQGEHAISWSDSPRSFFFSTYAIYSWLAVASDLLTCPPSPTFLVIGEIAVSEPAKIAGKC